MIAAGTRHDGSSRRSRSPGQAGKKKETLRLGQGPWLLIAELLAPGESPELVCVSVQSLKGVRTITPIPFAESGPQIGKAKPNVAA